MLLHDLVHDLMSNCNVFSQLRNQISFVLTHKVFTKVIHIKCKQGVTGNRKVLIS